MHRRWYGPLIAAVALASCGEAEGETETPPEPPPVEEPPPEPVVLEDPDIDALGILCQAYRDVIDSDQELASPADALEATQRLAVGRGGDMFVFITDRYSELGPNELYLTIRLEAQIRDDDVCEPFVEFLRERAVYWQAAVDEHRAEEAAQAAEAADAPGSEEPTATAD